MDKIDFVLIWVDDKDPIWQYSYQYYSKIELGDSRSIRFRDWGTLKYWFRGVEKFAPWVNNIFFITCGHYPDWLNLEHHKLKFVRHEDFIPPKYLPTFSANPIELNLHRIAELSEYFVYFNDDTFIIDSISKDRFFKDGKVRDIAIFNTLQPNGSVMDHIICNDVAIINEFFNKKAVLKDFLSKWINLKYGGKLLRTIALALYPKFTGFLDPHFPNPFYKKTLEDVWKLAYNRLDQTCYNKFRNASDVNQYLFRYFQLLNGDFMPINPWKTSECFFANDDKTIENAIDFVRNQKKPLVCINDGDISDFESMRSKLIAAFDVILPQKCGFEK